MKNKILKNVILIALRGVLLTLIILYVGTTTAEAENREPKGKNIIKDKPSSIPIPKEFDKIREEYEITHSEEEINELEKKLEEISQKNQEWVTNNIDTEKEKKVREKQKLLNDYLSDKNINETARTKLDEAITGNGFDLVNNSLEVNIHPQYFSMENIEEYIKIIRSVVGDEIDLTISQCGYATNQFK